MQVRPIMFSCNLLSYRVGSIFSAANDPLDKTSVHTSTRTTRTLSTHIQQRPQEITLVLNKNYMYRVCIKYHEIYYANV